MAANTIDNSLLCKMFLAGAKNLEANKEYINELNVFPVPDGDTGTNMTMTIMSAAKEVAGLDDTTEMKVIAKAISSGSLRGARGNSGVILSQLCRGFAKVIGEVEVIDKEILARACEKAVESAYKAVMKPKEGTILTVAKGVCEKVVELSADPEIDMDTLIDMAILYAKEVLDKTPEMLPVLKQAGVVDSGGYGLVTFLVGAQKAFRGEEIDFKMASECPICGSKLVKKKEDEASYYCTNSFCDAKRIESLIHFASRNAMNIEGFGDEIVEDFYNLGFLKKFTDFYTLKDHKHELMELEGFGDKSINKLF